MKRSFDLGDRNPNLTGDSQMELCLPTLKTHLKHPDLRTIDVHTMARLIRGEFDHVVSNYRVLDARYAYEFEGGHIRGAENYGLWDEKAFFDDFLPSEPKQLSSLSPSTSCPSSSTSGFSTDVIMSVIEEMDEEHNSSSSSHEPVVVEPKQEEPEQDNKAVGPKRNILIFHCEFSSARGPALMKELRKRYFNET